MAEIRLNKLNLNFDLKKLQESNTKKEEVVNTTTTNWNGLETKDNDLTTNFLNCVIKDVSDKPYVKEGESTEESYKTPEINDINENNRTGSVETDWVKGKGEATLEVTKNRAKALTKTAINNIKQDLIKNGCNPTDVNTVAQEITNYMNSYISAIEDNSKYLILTDKVYENNGFEYHQHTDIKGRAVARNGSTMVQLLEQTTLGRGYKIVVDKAMLADEFLKRLDELNREDGTKPTSELNLNDVNDENKTGTIESDWVHGSRQETLDEAKKQAMSAANQAVLDIIKDLRTDGYDVNQLYAAKDKLMNYLENYMNTIEDNTIALNLTNKFYGQGEFMYRQHSRVKGVPEFEPGTTMIQLLEQTTLGRGYKVVIDKAMLAEKFVQFAQELSNDKITNQDKKNPLNIDNVENYNKTGMAETQWTNGRKDYNLEEAKKEAIQIAKTLIANIKADLKADGVDSSKLDFAEGNLLEFMAKYIKSINDNSQLANLTDRSYGEGEFTYHQHTDIKGRAVARTGSTMVQLLEQTTITPGYKIVIDKEQLANKFIEFAMKAD